MRWGIEVWDKFEDVSNYVHKGIEFCEKFEEFCKRRCSIENSYAKNLRKLIDAYEPKTAHTLLSKKESDFISISTTPSLNTNSTQSTYLKCFAKMLNELRDSACQHELVAENVQEKILLKINQTLKLLKDERRSAIEEKDKYFAEHQSFDDQLEKCKVKYEKAFKEVEKAEDLLAKVENDDSASKNDIKKQKSICDGKKRTFDTIEAEYGKQLCEANRVKNLYYYEQLPMVFDQLQTIETNRIENFKSLVKECASIEIEVLPRILQCLKEVELAADGIQAQSDADVCVSLFKTGYQIPVDHVFVYLNSEKQHFNNSNTKNGDNINTMPAQLNGSINSNNSNGSNGNGHYSFGTLSHNTILTSATSLNTNKNRQNKYRTLNRIKGLFLATSSLNTLGQNKNSENDLFDLPPQQLKNELVKKISQIQIELDKHQKEREGLNKLKDIYSKNQKFGDSHSADSALKSNEERLTQLNNQLAKYQEILLQVEIKNGQLAANNTLSNQQHYSTSTITTTSTKNGGGEYSSSSSMASVTLPRDTQNSSNHIYQSPSKLSVDSTNNNNNMCSLPSTPMSSHIHNSTVAYAVSPVNLNIKAPLVSTNNNESFEDDDENNNDDDEDDVDDDDGCYESPTAALRNKIESYHIHQKSQSNLKSLDNNNSAAIGYYAAGGGSNSGGGNSGNSGSGGGGSEQYDDVDHNGLYVDEVNEPIIGTALVMYSFSGTVQNAMSIQESESLNVLEKDSGDGWTLVKRLNGEKGYVPTDYIQIVYY